MTTNRIAAAAFAAIALLAVLVFSLRKPLMQPPPPAWAFPVGAAVASKPSTADDTPMHLKDLLATYSRAQINDRFQVPDWHPDEHPLMPEVVAHGRKPNVFACGYCHLPNGQGRPENAALAGQPKAYIVQQVLEMREGRRHSSESRMGPPKLMQSVAQNVTTKELESAAGYFSALSYGPWIRVVESATVPKTFANSHAMMEVLQGAGSEPLGMRIIETGEDIERTELRDADFGFVAYVPIGSIARGMMLVRSGGGGQPCRTCHGPALKGMGDTPAIAGRSPSYVVRQLFDIQYGARSGPAVQPMRAEVAHMTDRNRIEIAAYLASLKP